LPCVSCRTIKCPSQVERSSILRNLGLSSLFDGGSLEGGDNALRIEVLELVVLGHELGQHSRELLDLRSQLELLDEAISVLFELLRLDLLVGVDEVNALVQVLDLLPTLLVFPRFVVRQVLEEDLGRQLCEWRREDVRLKLEELVNDVLVLHCVENIGRQSHDVLERLVEVVALETQLQLANVFSGDSLVVEVEQLRADGHRVDVLKAYREEHLTVSVQLLQHVRVAVLQHQEEFFDALEHEFFRL